MSQRLYQLGTLESPATSGSVRIITKADLAGGPPDEVIAQLDLLARWRAEFIAEVTGHGDESDQAAFINRAIVSGSAYAIWTNDGTPAAMAAASAPLGGMSRIGPVYTPPEHRRRGYGAAVTAGVARWTIEQGAESIILFTDLTNPTSNSIYQRIGFRPLFDAAEYRFGAAHD
jgi:predicted GNAT family acetyltransferase